MLRVISGTAKGHKLKTVKGDVTRPTSDRVKESLFNIIAPYIAESDVLDLFAGTGNLAIEALSRGAKTAVLVDKSHESIMVIKENLAHTKMVDRATVLVGDVAVMIKKLYNEGKKFDIIFLDPPYNKNLVQSTLNHILENDIITDGGIIVAERDKDDDVPEEFGVLKLIRDQKYGDTVLSFYKKG
ncbi:MAG: 16S rRNA (guanine(966)-N(2))-methyltransferase RsmD [Clostridia bacterium]|nr:16S rRNA (guanine(966)-N(2))-methyltransferase RsmD [Clostridia bacterium]